MWGLRAGIKERLDSLQEGGLFILTAIDKNPGVRVIKNGFNQFGMQAMPGSIDKNHADFIVATEVADQIKNLVSYTFVRESQAGLVEKFSI